MKKQLLVTLLLAVLFIGALWLSTGRAQIISQGNPVQQGGNAKLNSLTLATPLPPPSGGIGAMTGAPIWTHYFGTGAEGAGPANGTLAAGVHMYTSWSVTGAIICPATLACYVLSEGPVTLGGSASITGGAMTSVVNGTFGGAGGSGGSEGATNSLASVPTYWLNPGNAGISGAIFQLSAAAGASTTSIGNDGGAISAALAQAFVVAGPAFKPSGGGIGTVGANTGGSAGVGLSGIIIIAPSITLASGAVLNTSGGQGGDATALLHGGGGGAGGSNIYLFSETFTDNGAIYKYGGGPGGNCTSPSISIANGCTTLGCGKDAQVKVTGLTAGGLDANKTSVVAGGTGYLSVPDCIVNANGSGITGASCTAVLTGTAVSSVTVTAGSGGTYADYSASCQYGGWGAIGWYAQQLMQ